MRVTKKYFHYLLLFGLSLVFTISPLAGCTSQENQEPAVKTTVAPSPLPKNSPQPNLKKEKPKPKLQSFGKNEPAWV